MNTITIRFKLNDLNSVRLVEWLALSASSLNERSLGKLVPEFSTRYFGKADNCHVLYKVKYNNEIVFILRFAKDNRGFWARAVFSEEAWVCFPELFMYPNLDLLPTFVGISNHDSEGRGKTLEEAKANMHKTEEHPVSSLSSLE